MAKFNLKLDYTLFNQRLWQLKQQLQKHALAGYIIPSTDEYLSEFTPLFAKRLQYITGFSGSYGICLVLQDKGLFFTDGRYLKQSTKQLDLSFFQIFDLKGIGNFPFKKYIKAQEIIGYDPRLFTKHSLKMFSSLSLRPLPDNLVDKIWHNQPARPSSKVDIYPQKYAGQSYLEKINLCRKIITTYPAQALVISSSDTVCWLLNLRARDLEFSPVMLSYAVITVSSVHLFTNTTISNHVKKLRQEVEILREEQLPGFLKSIDGRVLIDENLTAISITTAIKDTASIQDPCKHLKAIKNKSEIKHAAAAHIKDAVALCEFFAWLTAKTPSNLTEYDIACKLTAVRAQQPGYVMDSFPTICGFKENSAIIHYHADAQTAKKIQGSGLLLIDSGGQYMGATTDITRTIAIGKPSLKQINCYTNVLRGHIHLSNIKFLPGTTGANLDILARQYLWSEHLDYPHATGHGVGSYLNVHEGPQGINFNNHLPLEPGMIISNEPGYYQEEQFGIRIENLMYVKAANKQGFLQFATLSLVPYAHQLIDYNKLTGDELKYLKQYYQTIYKSIYHLLSQATKNWLLAQLTC